MLRLSRRAVLPFILAAGLAGSAQAAPALYFQTINGSSQLAGINALQIVDTLYDIRWNSTLNYYDTFSATHPRSPTFMDDPTGAAAAAAAIAAFIGSVASLPGDVGFQSFRPNDGSGAVLPLRFIGMIPATYGYDAQYARWESSGAAIQFDAVPALDATGNVDPAAYGLGALAGGFAAITNETGPGGRGVIDANPGWAFVSFTSLGGAVGVPAGDVPEPALAGLLATGFAAMAYQRRRAQLCKKGQDSFS